MSEMMLPVLYERSD